MNFYIWLGNSPLRVQQRHRMLYHYEMMTAEGLSQKTAIAIIAQRFNLWQWVVRRILKNEIAADPIQHVLRVDRERQRLNAAIERYDKGQR